MKKRSISNNIELVYPGDNPEFTGDSASIAIGENPKMKNLTMFPKPENSGAEINVGNAYY